MDLAEAHLASLNRLISQPTVDAVEYYNLGTGKGCSVLEVIASFEKVNQTKVPYKIGPRRAGDVVQVWADSSKAKQMLGWEAKRGLDEMMKDAWNWQLRLKNSADS
jgi:UDP-glucose 4-epimerase